MDPVALPSQATHKLLVKHGDDLRQDMLILHALRLMERVRTSGPDQGLELHGLCTCSPLPSISPFPLLPHPTQIWQDDNLHLCLTPYNCAANGTLSGMIEVVLGAETLAAVREPASTSACAGWECHMQRCTSAGVIRCDEREGTLRLASGPAQGVSVV